MLFNSRSCSWELSHTGSTVFQPRGGLQLLCTPYCEGTKATSEVTETKETIENSLYNDKIFQASKG